jgi:hypothetical protein
MMRAANTVTYIVACDAVCKQEGWNWLLAKRFVEFHGLHIG